MKTILVILITVFALSASGQLPIDTVVSDSFKTRYAILTQSEYFELNETLSEAQGFELSKKTERYDKMILTPIYLEDSTIAYVMPITSNLQRNYPELLPDTLYEKYTLADSIINTTIEVDNNTDADWLINHYEAAGGDLTLLQSKATRTTQSDYAVVNLKEKGVTVVTFSIDKVGKYLVFADNTSKYIKTGRVEATPETIVSENLDIPATNFEDLPSKGWVQQDMMYNYNGKTVLCIRGHNRTIYTPENTPALFSFYRAESEDMVWITNEKVEVADLRIFNSVKYECLQAHQTQDSWNPELTINVLWKTYSSGGDIPAWVQPTGGHDAYNIGDKVTFEGNTYESLINGNSWSPTTYPAGWKKL